MATDDRTEAAPEILGAQFLRDFTDRWHAAWNAHDPAQVAALCTDDIQWQQSSTPPLPAGYEGAAVVVQQLHRAFPDFRFEGTESPYASFDRRKAIVPWQFTGTMTGLTRPAGLRAHRHPHPVRGRRPLGVPGRPRVPLPSAL